MGDMNNEARSEAGGTEAASEEISEVLPVIMDPGPLLSTGDQLPLVTLQDVQHALVLVKQLQRENKQLADNFDSVSTHQAACGQLSSAPWYADSH
jgi:hypothetical protein